LQGAPVRASLTPANIGLTGSRRLSGTNGAALVGTAPATISAPAAVAGIPYCVLT
jgi:hypothetical protein